MKRPKNVGHHAIEIGVDGGIPESERLEALAFQDRVPNQVVSSLDIIAMTTSINFDDQAAAEADEIEEIAPEGSLTAEVKAPAAESA